MDRKRRYVIYILLCFGIMLLPNIMDVCLNCGNWSHETLEYKCSITSLWIAVVLFTADYLYGFYKRSKSTDIKSYKTDVSPFYFDFPNTEDIFKRNDYAKLLLQKIYSSFYNNNSPGSIVQHSFVIHIGEHYGQGKTSFLIMLENESNKNADECPVVYINFKPWLCDTATGIITEFFSIFRENLKRLLPKLDKTIKDYALLLLSSIEYNSVRFSFDFAPFGKRRICTLKDSHDLIRDELQKIDRPIIITIDDVDRLDSMELMMVLKIIRDTADFPNVFYIIAADNIHLKKMLNIQHIDDAETYLEKFFNFEFQLPANENVAFYELLKMLREKFEEIQILNADGYLQQIINLPHIKDIFSNMRDVYKFTNTYYFVLDSMEYAKDINLFDLFLLTVIQMQDLEYYMQLRDSSLNIFDVKRYGNDVILVWKERLNVVKACNDRDISNRLKTIATNRGLMGKNEANETAPSIPNFTDTKESTKIAADKIIPEIMNLLFGYYPNSTIEANRICRYNMYFKYFANTNASYMVSRMEIVSLLNAGGSTYRKELDSIFKQERDNMFLAEFINAIPDTDEVQDATILKRFFIFIELSYKYKREITIPGTINSLAEYEGYETSRNKLYSVLSFIYGSARIERTSEVAKQKKTEFLELCNEYDDINILLVCVNIMSDYLRAFIFDRNDIYGINRILVKRFFVECIANSGGNIDIQEADTIIQIKCDCEATQLWEDLLEKYLENNMDALLNMLCKLVHFYPDEIRWDYSFHKALLGEYQLQGGNMLSRLGEKYPDLKGLLNSIEQLHNNNPQTLAHVSNLENNAFIKMAKERQIRLNWS